MQESHGDIIESSDQDDSSELLAKAKLAAQVLKVIEKRGLTQKEAASLLGTDQSYISKLKKGSEMKRFTYDRLINWLKKLGHKLVLNIESKDSVTNRIDL